MKKKENYKLLAKLIARQFEAGDFELDEDNYQVELKVKEMCTAQVCLCVAIAKKTKSSMYLNNGKFIFYINTYKPIAHYMRWADKHIKKTIELEA